MCENNVLFIIPEIIPEHINYEKHEEAGCDSRPLVCFHEREFRKLPVYSASAALSGRITMVFMVPDARVALRMFWMSAGASALTAASYSAL